MTKLLAYVKSQVEFLDRFSTLTPKLHLIQTYSNNISDNQYVDEI